MAEEPKTEKTITDKETTKKKVKIGAAKATEPAAAEVVSPPAAPASVAPKKSMKKNKLLPKNKHRLPRRQKKAQHEAATRL